MEAPRFNLERFPEKSAFDSKALLGKWTLLHFWATWCAPCREELPSLEVLSRHFKGRLPVLAVSVDEERADLSTFFGRQVPSFEVLHDKARQTANAYHASKFPETFLLSPDGHVRMRFVGQRDWADPAVLGYFDQLIARERSTTLAHSS
jgi:thiol-disulfide isomerase/thioredoxin